MKRQLLVIVSIALISFLVGTMVSFTASALDVGSPFDKIWQAITGIRTDVSELEDEVENLEEQTPLPGVISAPAYDSGWIDITDKAGRDFTLTHSLNSTDIIVDIIGKTTQDGGTHQLYLGLTGYINGFEKTYGGTNRDIGNAVIQTSDGGYAIAGYISSYTGTDAYLVKTDATGTMRWDQTYGGTDNYYGNAVIQTSDGGYAIAGYVRSSTGTDVCLIKTDAVGNMLWTKAYGGTGVDYGRSLIQSTDGGYVIAGYTNSSGVGGNDVYLVKTDISGTMLWNRTYGGTSNDSGNCVVQTADGGYAIVGVTYSYGVGTPAKANAWLIKTGSTGNAQWNRTYGGTGGDFGASLIQSVDGGYAIAGNTNSTGAGGRDMYFVKTDSSGNTLWNKTYGRTGDEYGASLVQSVDEGYAIAGYSVFTGPGKADVCLVKIDKDGNLIWNATYGGRGNDFANLNSLVQTADGGYVIVGYTDSFGAGVTDVYLIKTSIESGLARISSTADTITLYKGATDIYWNYVRVRIWRTKNP